MENPKTGRAPKLEVLNEWVRLKGEKKVPCREGNGRNLRDSLSPMD